MGARAKKFRAPHDQLTRVQPGFEPLEFAALQVLAKRLKRKNADTVRQICIERFQAEGLIPDGTTKRTLDSHRARLVVECGCVVVASNRLVALPELSLDSSLSVAVGADVFGDATAIAKARTQLGVAANV